jgi:molybdate transport system substrate-binding protein
MKNLLLVVLLGVFTMTFFGCGTPEKKGVIRLACAASMQPVFDSIKTNFEKQTNWKVEVISNASGNLYAQISEGAPYDLFFSADVNYPMSLYAQKKCRRPFTYATGKLILVQNILGKHTNYEELIVDQDVKRIALADTVSAPYGIAAKKALIEQGLWPLMKDKVVYAESIGQVNQYLKAGAVDAAFTSYTYTMQNKGQNYFQISLSENNQIKHAGAVLNYGSTHHGEGCELFLVYLKRQDTKQIFTYFGLD